MESVDVILAREFPAEIVIPITVPVLDELARIRDRLRGVLPPDTVIDLQEWMGRITIAVTPFRGPTATRTAKVVR